jgi:peptide subunit release factor 1 (eRF1)
LRLRRTRTEARRSFSRRLIDEEAREFVEHELEETRDVYRTASGEFQLEALCRDVFASARTTDVRWLKERGVDGEDFYRRELGPSWDGLSQHERAGRIERFVELSHMLGGAANGGEPDPELRDLIATVHVKVLLLAWSYDRSYGFIDRLFNGPLQYRAHLRRNGV